MAHAAIFKSSANERTAAVVQQVCEVLLRSEAELNALDAKVGDGDTGTTFATAARSVRDELVASTLPLAASDQLCLAIGDRLGRAAGGSSGVLMSIFFTAAGAGMARSDSWLVALENGVAALVRYGGAKPGDRTLLDALVPALEALEQGGIGAAAAAAEHGAAATASMKRARAGRASYVPAANLLGVEDPGATAVALAFRAAADATLAWQRSHRRADNPALDRRPTGSDRPSDAPSVLPMDHHEVFEGTVKA